MAETSEVYAPPNSSGTGQQLLVTMLQTMSIERPNQAWAKVPKSTITYDEGFCRITYRQLAKSADSLAGFIEGQIGTGHGLSTLAYFGPRDPRFSMLILAASKAGHKVRHGIVD